MKKEVGVWIDHREAIIVTVEGARDEIRRVESGMEKHVRFHGGAGSRAPHVTQAAEDKRERQFEDHLHKYYDEVVSSLRDAESILILGPGEAKTEFQKRLEGAGLGERIVGAETVDKMTERQIAARVRENLRSKP